MAVSKSTRAAKLNTIPNSAKTASQAKPTRNADRRNQSQSVREAPYELVYLLNLHGKRIVTLIAALQSKACIPNDIARYYQTQIREAVSLASQDALERMTELEIRNSFITYQARKQQEKQLFSED